MRISSKGRYALVSMIGIAQTYHTGECITVISISERFGISKIYLEQVFSLLKRGGLVNSIKGAQGGYQLAKHPRKINAYEILSATELSMFERAEETVEEKSPSIEMALRELVFTPLDNKVKDYLEKISLEDLVTEAEKHKEDDEIMFFI